MKLVSKACREMVSFAKLLKVKNSPPGFLGTKAKKRIVVCNEIQSIQKMKEKNKNKNPPPAQEKFSLGRVLGNFLSIDSYKWDF